MGEIKKWEENEHWVEIDLELCVGAAECIEVCPVKVYDLKDGKVTAENIGECIECMACEGVCPTNAILKHFTWK